MRTALQMQAKEPKRGENQKGSQKNFHKKIILGRVKGFLRETFEFEEFEST